MGEVGEGEGFGQQWMPGFDHRGPSARYGGLGKGNHPRVVGGDRLLPRMDEQAADGLPLREELERRASVISPRVHASEAARGASAPRAGVGQAGARRGQVVVGRLGRRGEHAVHAVDLGLLTQLRQRPATSEQARPGVYDHGPLPMYAVKQPALVVAAHEPLLLGREPGPAHFVELDSRRAARGVRAEDHPLGADAAHRFAGQLGVGTGRCLEQHIGAPLGHREGIGAVVVGAHVA